MFHSHKGLEAATSKTGQVKLQTSATGSSKASAPGLTFLFQTDTLAPNFEILGAQVDDFDNWVPPFHWNAYRHVNGRLYRWADGRVTSTAPGTIKGNQHSCATVFTQYPDTGHFLAVAYDARTQNVVQYGNWQKIGFHHVDLPNGRQYSELDFGPRCANRRLAAPPSPGSVWENELFTAEHEHHGPALRQSAGLTGKLSLILAIVAQCCPPAQLDQVLTNSIRSGQWISHGAVQPGRTQYRGVVVTIWLDPTSITTAGVLNDMEGGRYGAFFR